MNDKQSLTEYTPINKSPQRDGAECSLPCLEFDLKDYADDIKEFNLSDQEAQEFLTALWDIMRMLAEMGFGVESVQNIFYAKAEKCGGVLKNEPDFVDDKGTADRKEISDGRGN